jgi:parvulin-like peptidyl-prolyl isomerase
VFVRFIRADAGKSPFDSAIVTIWMRVGSEQITFRSQTVKPGRGTVSTGSGREVWGVTMDLKRAWLLLLCTEIGFGCTRAPNDEAKKAPVQVSRALGTDSAPEERVDSADKSAIEEQVKKPRRSMYSSYPRGRWRLVPIAELQRVQLWASHILVRHEESLAAETPFSEVPGWEALDSPPSRTRDEALQLAQQIAVEARQSPGEFARLCEKYSEDIETRTRGGSLGGIAIGSWAVRWPQAVDALAATTPGQVSSVVETEFGFHVLLRRAPPAPTQVAAQRIIIGHGAAPFLGTVSVPVKRPRGEALELATRIAAEARGEISRFPELVDRYTEGPDKDQAGDIGVWSSREVSTLGREIEALAASSVGDVIGPFDSAFGFQVLLRTPVIPRKKYAAAIAKFPFDADAPADSEKSKAAALARARELIQATSKHTKLVGDLKEGGERVSIAEQWTAGRGAYRLDHELEQMGIGGVTPEPVERTWFYVVAQRLDPATQPRQPEPLFELRSPKAPDVFYAAELAPREWLAGVFDKARSRLPPPGAAKGLQPDDCAKAYQVVEDAIKASNEGIARLERFKGAWSELRECLGSASFDGYQAAINQLIEAEVLKTEGS